MKSIVIIGAGFSGVALVSQLLRQAGTAPLRIVLVNRSGSMARGLAYGTRSADHVLNVPAGNMSAMAEDPDHFLRYAPRPAIHRCRRIPSCCARVYGDYLESLLKSAEQSLQSNIYAGAHHRRGAVHRRRGGRPARHPRQWPCH